MVDNVLFKHFKAIGDIKSVINGASDIEDALHKCVDIIREVSGAETAVIWYFDKDGDKLLHPTYAKGAHTFVEGAVASGEGLVGQVFSTGEALFLPEGDPAEHIVTMAAALRPLDSSAPDR